MFHNQKINILNETNIFEETQAKSFFNTQKNIEKKLHNKNK